LARCTGLQFGLAGRWNLCTKRTGATELRSHFSQFLLNGFHRLV